jgi:hypothetical protein
MFASYLRNKVLQSIGLFLLSLSLHKCLSLLLFKILTNLLIFKWGKEEEEEGGGRGRRKKGKRGRRKRVKKIGFRLTFNNQLGCFIYPQESIVFQASIP